MNTQVVCSHCEQLVPASKYYDHLVQFHGEDED